MRRPSSVAGRRSSAVGTVMSSLLSVKPDITGTEHDIGNIGSMLSKVRDESQNSIKAMLEGDELEDEITLSPNSHNQSTSNKKLRKSSSKNKVVKDNDNEKEKEKEAAFLMHGKKPKHIMDRHQNEEEMKEKELKKKLKQEKLLKEQKEKLKHFEEEFSDVEDESSESSDSDGMMAIQQTTQPTLVILPIHPLCPTPSSLSLLSHAFLFRPFPYLYFNTHCLKF